MPKHPTPRERREIAAKFAALCRDHHKADAAQMVGDEYGIHPGTVGSIVRRLRADGDTFDQSPQRSVVYSPFNLSPKEPAAVELNREVTTEVFLSDIHFHPESNQGHDPAAWAVVERFLEHIKPDIVFFGGDIMDCYAPSRYDKIPRLATPEAFRGEIEYGKEKMREIRSLCPDSRLIWLTGNHELRLPRSIASNAPWLYQNIMDIEGMLELSSLDIQLVEDGYQIGKLRHYHGHNNPGSGRVNTAKTKFERLLCNAIFGHHHKFSKWFQRDQDGGYFGAFVNGTIQWLSTDYAPNADWTQGFSVIQYSRSGNFNVDQVLIHKPSVWSHKAEAIYAGTHVKVDMERS